MPIGLIQDEVVSKMDGRNGKAEIGGIRFQGFALMRDSLRRLIAFQATPEELWALSATESPTRDQFVISEDAFEPEEG